VRYAREVHRIAATVIVVTLLAGCAGLTARETVRFANVTPGAPFTIEATLVRPRGTGPFPAVVQLHGCGGIEAQSFRWARWLADHGYVALVVDSFGPRKVKSDCRSGPDEPPITTRFDDAFGALRYLQSRPDVRGDRVAVIGWSQGGVYAMAVINGPSLERARRRGVALPRVGFAAGVGVYPGGCFSLVGERVVRPLLVLIGEADDWTPAAPCKELVATVAARGDPMRIVTYPDAYHDFDNPGIAAKRLRKDVPGGVNPGKGVTTAPNPEAREDAKKQVLEFFAKMGST